MSSGADHEGGWEELRELRPHRCAKRERNRIEEGEVIVPEGVLYGSTEAHIRLRRRVAD